jgi:multisubunit Na+/H+ antiporter MnhG subunit
VERTGVRETFGRALRLARVDYVHALGSVATLAIVGLLTALVLFFLLRGQGEATLAVAAFLSVLVIAPVIFLGGAMLYVDQAARVAVVDSGTSRKRVKRSA